jgi:hypothetical protein
VNAEHPEQRLTGRQIVDGNPVLDRDRNGDRSTHRGHAVCDKIRLRHQAGTESTGLDPF